MSLASLGALRALAASAPVIIAIDDVQWLDVPSARVLAFVVRRLEDAPIRILVAPSVPPSSELTPTEQRIPELVGEGKRHRKVADALFISVKTVEGNLARIFHKLGVRSRTGAGG